MVRSPHFRGYTRLGGELTRGEADWRERIDVGPERPPIGGPGRPDYQWLQGPNQWPATQPELAAIIDEWCAALAPVARTPTELRALRALRALAPGAGSDDPFDPIYSVYGRNAWKSRVRAHPDVAAAHGYSPDTRGG